MRKIWIIMVVLGLAVLVLGGCGVADYLNNQKATVTKVSKLPEMVLNEPFVVTTISGDYSLTIEGVRTTSERNPKSETNPGQVVFLDYSYENLSYQKRNEMDFFLAQGDFAVTDDYGNKLEVYNIKDPNRMIQETPIGGRCSASIAYGLETDSNNLTVTFVRGKGREIATITVPIQ